MGFSCFTKILRYTSVAAVAAAAAFVGIVALSFPASATSHNDGGGNSDDLKSWDTDNLAYGGYSAKNHRIPYHDYSGEVRTVDAIPCVQYSGISTLVQPHIAATGMCPSGYSQLRYVCYYGERGYHFPPRSHLRCVKNFTFYNPDSTYYIVSVSGYRVPLTDAIRYCANGTLGTSCTKRTVSFSPHQACRSAIADAFFQTGGDTGAVNDFPVARYDEKWAVVGTGTRSTGCLEFVEQQDRLQASVTATGHYLAVQGNDIVLKSNTADQLDARVTSVRSAGVYGLWYQKGSDYAFFQRGTKTSRSGVTVPASSSSVYNARVDTRAGLAVASGLSSSLVYPWNVAAGLGSGQGSRRCSAVGSGYCWQSSDGSTWSSSSSGSVFRTAVQAIPNAYGPYGRGVIHLSHSQDSGGGWCPAGWHPRGQDGHAAISSGTGRTLSSINTDAKVKTADSFWCRSDVRFNLKFTAQQHRTHLGYVYSAPAGVSLPATGSNFSSLGRKNCYKTMTGYDTAAAECVYVFPLPECDPDPDNGTDTDWREFTAAEVANIGVADEPLTVGPGVFCGTNINPPDLAGFDADPCVVVGVSVFENRVAGANAEPGVASGDRTRAVGEGAAVYDLDVSAPFPKTASPPRDTTAGTGDPSGCSDGEEERTSHGSRAAASDAVLPSGSNQRKNAAALADPARPHSTPLPLPSSSSADNTAPPPSDYDADNSYGGARANMAHRYASAIAENTCAAKRAEAELVLAVLEAREASYVQWLEDYKTAADANKAKFASYVPVRAGATGLSALWAADIATERTRAAAALDTAYKNLSDALAAARTAYNTATDQTQNLAKAAGSYTSLDTNGGCPGVAVKSRTTQTANESDIRGSEGTMTAWPETDKPAKPTEIYTQADTPVSLLPFGSLLGRYLPSHSARANLVSPDAFIWSKLVTVWHYPKVTD